MKSLFDEIKDLEIVMKTALNGQEAINVVKKTKGTFSHIFLDLLMPIMNGYQVHNYYTLLILYSA